MIGDRSAHELFDSLLPEEQNEVVEYMLFLKSSRPDGRETMSFTLTAFQEDCALFRRILMNRSPILRSICDISEKYRFYSSQDNLFQSCSNRLDVIKCIVLSQRNSNSSFGEAFRHTDCL